MSALYKTLKLGSAPRLLQLAAPPAASGQKRHLNLLEYQAKGLLQVGTALCLGAGGGGKADCSVLR